MRISDWSSDVCSSDLDRADAEQRQLNGTQRSRQRLLLCRCQNGVERFNATKDHQYFSPAPSAHGLEAPHGPWLAALGLVCFNFATTRKISAALREHRPEPASGKDMDVQMRHLLVRGGPRIGEQSIARFLEPQIARYLSYCPHESGDFGLARLGGKVRPRDISPLGNDQHMNRRLWVDAVDSQRVLCIVNCLLG